MPPALLALPLCAALLAGGCSHDEASTTAEESAATASTGSTASAPAPTPLASQTAPEGSAPGGSQGAEEDPVAARQMPAQDVAAETVLDSGTAVSLGEMSAKRFPALVPGEVAGDGVVVPVTIVNNGSDLIPLDSLAVTFFYGQDNTPASPMPSASDEVPTSVTAGESVTISYAFRVPAESREHVRVVVDLDVSDRAAVFEGAGPAA